MQYGIPTVVESAVLVNDCLDLFIEKLQQEAKSNEYLNKLKEQDNYEEIKEALNPSDYNMIVTPKEIDELIENMSSIVARGINMSLWPIVPHCDPLGPVLFGAISDLGRFFFGKGTVPNQKNVYKLKIST